MRTRQRELRIVMIERRAGPSLRRMADGTVLRILLGDMIGISHTIVVFLVARPAVYGRTLKHAAYVAIEAIGLNVRTRQGELGRIVRKAGFLPIARVVALRAVLRIALREVILCFVVLRFMTRPAVRRSLRVSTRVTFQTIGLNMRASQRERRQIMIPERRIGPFRRRVTGLAIRRKELGRVHRIRNAVVIFFVALNTCGRRAGILSADVALRTVRLHVRTSQRESCLVVPRKLRRLPGIYRVTLLAGRRKSRSFVVRVFSLIVIRLMALRASGRRVGKTARMT